VSEGIRQTKLSGEQGRLVYYDVMSQKVTGRVKDKARAFVQKGLVSKSSKYEYSVLPIKGYNKTTYTISTRGDYSCNCQFYVKTGRYCSHCLAVMLYEKIYG